MLQKGTFGIFEKIVILGVMWFILHYVDLQFTKHIPQKKSPVLIHLRSYFNRLHKPFLLSYKKKHGAEKRHYKIVLLFLAGMFPCYLTANAFNDRVLRLQNEFLCLSCLNGNCQTVERDAFLCVLGVVHIASNRAKLRHFQFSVSTSTFLLLTVHVLCCVN